MTKTEMADLDRAIGLINDLREEMQKGFSTLNTSVGEVKESQAAHLAVHEERDKVAAGRGVSKRWVIGVVATSTLTIIGFILGGIYHFLGI